MVSNMRESPLARVQVASGIHQLMLNSQSIKLLAPPEAALRGPRP
jgi:hypothetical protein